MTMNSNKAEESINHSITGRRARPSVLEEPSLSLQILLFLNGWYTTLWFISNVILLSWKRTNFFYETSSFRWEVTMVIFVAIIDLIRVEVATKGNKVGEWRILLTSSCLSLPVIVGMVFFLRLQTYVLRLDVIFNIIGLVLLWLETLLQISTLIGCYLYYRIGVENNHGTM